MGLWNDALLSRAWNWSGDREWSMHLAFLTPMGLRSGLRRNKEEFLWCSQTDAHDQNGELA
jgi:hypothetical protein